MPKINASPAWKKRRHWSKERTVKPKRQTNTARLIVLLNKPYDVLCQFTDDAGRATLADYVTIPGVYAAGRLDRDSEGLLLLTNDGGLQAKLTQPGKNTEKTYWVQVDGAITDEAIAQLRQGVTLNDGPTKAARVERFTPPADLWPRDPPVRYRAAIPTTWIAITISEGRNRQVRRMTAAVGYPTLRLIRYRIGPYTLDGLAVGQCRTVQEE